MKELRFDWDPDKGEGNLRKHGVSFEEAVTVFYDESALQFYDEEHGEKEDRFLMLGLSSRWRLLLVCHTYREEESIIRLISARRATKREAGHYRR